MHSTALGQLRRLLPPEVIADATRRFLEARRPHIDALVKLHQRVTPTFIVGPSGTLPLTIEGSWPQWAINERLALQSCIVALEAHILKQVGIDTKEDSV